MSTTWSYRGSSKSGALDRMRQGELDLNGRRGSTLLSVVILAGALTVLTLIFLRVGARVTDEQLASVEKARASYLAEAGISEALEAIRSGRSGNVGTIDDPAYLGGGVVWVEATDLGNQRTQLDSMAMKDGGRAALRVVVQGGAGGGGGAPGGGGGNDPFFTMLFGFKKLILNLNVLIDSWDSTLGPYALQATNLKDGLLYAGSAGGASGNDEISLNNGVHVFGDVHSGPGQPVIMGSGAYVSGSTTPNEAVVPLAPITVPVIAPNGAISVANGKTKTIDAGTYHFTDVSIGKGGKLIINGPATLVWDAFTTLAFATIELNCTNGPITVYDTGKWVVDKNFTLAPSLGSPVDAAFMVTKGTVRFQQGSKVYAGFYCPEATIQVDSGAEIWGAMVADMINIGQGVHFHFDENLKNFPLPWDVPDLMLGIEGSPAPEVISWSKIEFPVNLYKADRRDPFTLLGVQKANLRSPAEAWEDEGGGQGGSPLDIQLDIVPQ